MVATCGTSERTRHLAPCLAHVHLPRASIAYRPGRRGALCGAVSLDMSRDTGRTEKGSSCGQVEQIMEKDLLRGEHGEISLDVI